MIAEPLTDHQVWNFETYWNEAARQYLIAKNWHRLEFNKWVHRDCRYECAFPVAVAVQWQRDEYAKLPWYRKLYRKIFE